MTSTATTKKTKPAATRKPAGTERPQRFRVRLESVAGTEAARFGVAFDVQKVFGTRARVPVRGTLNGAPFRADAMTHDGFTLPESFHGPRAAESRRAYAAYVGRIKARLERLPPDGFTPSLRLPDEALSSLRINR